eukprot:10876-Heterococcus_DN1.PRE.1
MQQCRAGHISEEFREKQAEMIVSQWATNMLRTHCAGCPTVWQYASADAKRSNLQWVESVQQQGFMCTEKAAICMYVNREEDLVL